MKPKISIAMATYNGERYLPEQLASFAAQTLLPDELVVCDDGSTDGSWEILSRFRDTAPFAVHLYRNDGNLGCARNFERAISLTLGDIIFLSDQDDYWFPDKLQVIASVFDSDERALVVTNDQEIADAALRPTGITTFGQFDAGRYAGTYFAVACCTAMRASLKQLYLPLPAELNSHDGWLNDLGNFLGARRIVRSVLQYHRRHDRNTSEAKLNPMVRLNLARRIRQTLAADIGLHFGFRRVELLALTARLRSTADGPSKMTISAEVFGRIARELAAIERRTWLGKLPRWRRPLPAFGMLRRGDYRSFSGWKSLMVDLIR